MTEKKLVVVGVDGSPDAEKAVRWAVDFADRTDADLLLVTAWQWPSSYGAPVWLPDFRPDEEARAVVEKAQAAASRARGGVEIAVCEGRAGRVLVARSEYAEALVIGSRGHGAVAETLLGSVSAYWVRHAHCPVVVVR